MIKKIKNTLVKGAEIAKNLAPKKKESAKKAAKKVNKLSDSGHKHGFLGDPSKLMF